MAAAAASAVAPFRCEVILNVLLATRSFTLSHFILWLYVDVDGESIVVVAAAAMCVV